MDLTLRGGLVVTAEASFHADVGVDEGRIVALGEHLPPGRRDIDIRGRWLLPGFIDTHTHFDVMLEPFGLQSPDDFTSGTRQAAAGGVTTVVDYAFQTPGESLHEAVEAWGHKAEGKCHVDYGFHAVVTDPRPEVLREMKDMVADGYTTFKVFMVHGFGDHTDRDLFRILSHSRKAGGMVTVHAENGDLIEAQTEELLDQGLRGPDMVPRAWTVETESEAAHRIISLARAAGDAPLLIVHLSSAPALDAVREGRRRGQRLYAETRPTYLVLDDSYYARPPEEAVRYLATPPLRTAEHGEALWIGLRNGDLQTVASDHTAWNANGQKDLGVDDFTRIPPGIPATETMGPLLYTYGVGRGRISANRWVEVLATNPAKLFGLYPEKGTVAIGSDADLVVFDPGRELTLSKAVTHSNVDYEPYAGFPLKGYPVLTLLRGEVVMEEGRIVTEPGAGRLIRRHPFKPL